MRDRDASRREAEPALRPGSSAELDRLLATVRRRRLLQAERTRAAGGDVMSARASRVVPSGGSSRIVPSGGSSRVPNAPPREASEARGAPARAVAAATDAGGVVLEALDVGPAVRILRVERPRGFSFQAGQAVKLGLPGTGTRRTYSIASAPHDPQLEFCVERVPGGRLSSLLFRLAPGARLELAPKPKGSFTLQSGKRVHLMVAPVTGIAPLRSMLRAALAAPSDAAEFWILHGASHADELPYAAELAELSRRDPRVHYLPTVSRPGASRNAGWTGRTGRVEAHLLETVQALGAHASLATKASIAVYACGHPEMVRNVQDALGTLGYAVSGEDFG